MCLKRPTSVKGHDASAEVVENQHKTLGKKYRDLMTVNLNACPLVAAQLSGLYWLAGDSEPCIVVHKRPICPEMRHEKRPTEDNRHAFETGHTGPHIV